MSKITLASVASGYDLSKVNDNFQIIQEAIDNTLSRNGTSPNSMSADIDMNGNRVYNLPDPELSSEAATKGWVEAQPASAAADAVLAQAAAEEAVAAAAIIDGFEWTGGWVTATAYAVNNLAYESGNTYICLVAHTSGTFGTDFGAGKWELFSAKGAAGAGTGDMLGSNNLSDLTDFTVARATLGVQPTASPTFTGTVTIPTPVGASDTTVAATTEWVRDTIAALASVIPTGVSADYVGTTAPTGWVLLSGRTIGSASSGATERANADTETLYTLLWNSMSNTEAPVSTGRGASAAADFAANKTLTLPDARGRVVAGKDDMGGSTASRITNAGAGIVGTTLGVAGGAQNVTLTAAESGLPSHTHAIYIAGGGGTGSDARADFSVSTGFVGASGVVQSSGSSSASSAHNNTQPTLILNKIVKL